jgi:hypothetical protein
MIFRKIALQSITTTTLFRECSRTPDPQLGKALFVPETALVSRVNNPSALGRDRH